MRYLNDISYKDCVGKILKSKNSGDFKIVKYNNSRNVDIQFINTRYETGYDIGWESGVEWVNGRGSYK